VHDAAFDGDRRATLERAAAAGISEIVTVGEDIADSHRALACAEEFGLWAAAGIHPHEAKDAPDDIEGGLAPLLAAPRTIALGEIGLDYYYDHSPREAQQRALRQQLQVARKSKTPVIFHHRDAFEDFIRILEEEWQPGMHGIVHCFTGNASQARTYIEVFGLKLGIGGVLTFRGAQAIRDAVRTVGVEACVLETDCPYLAPVPHRGKRNEPAFVRETAKALSEVVQRPLEEVLAVTDANAKALFGFTKP